jgi:hypothetical protein
LISNWRRFVFLAPIVLGIGALYAAIFWNNPNSFGQPVRSFRTVFMSESVSERDRSSDDYRRIEKQNLWFGIKQNPIRGNGFGKPFAKPIKMIDLSNGWPFWDFIPHNNVLWLWHKGGVLTFMTFWFFLGTSISQGVATVRALRNPLLTAIVGSVFAYLVMTVMFAYVDLGLTSMRVMILLGIALGLLSALDLVWTKSDQAPLKTNQEVP